jgi:alkylated DNA repair dioxygenase AlkB
MARQNALFPEGESKLERSTPPGFRYQENAISETEEAALVASVAELELKPFEFHGHLGNRRVISFGLRYDYSRRTVETASDFPSFLEELRGGVAEFASRGVNEFRQAGINEYRPGAGIGWHKDKPQVGIIVGVSLLAPARMRFRRAHAGTHIYCRFAGVSWPAWWRINEGIAPVASGMNSMFASSCFT